MKAQEILRKQKEEHEALLKAAEEKRIKEEADKLAEQELRKKEEEKKIQDEEYTIEATFG